MLESNRSRRNEDWDTLKTIERQIFDIMSELEYFNYFENLLSFNITDGNIDINLPSSEKDFDLLLELGKNKVWIDVKNLFNIEKKHDINITKIDTINSHIVITSGISSPQETAEISRRKILDKISDKLTGLNPADIHDPIIIALSP
ncbi:MAG: hypothetical protein ACTSPV_14490, partial [Candidatus Hodarchaeales archaeon]